MEAKNMDEKTMQFFMAEDEKRKNQLIENYRRLNKIAVKGQILFTGSSLMEQFPVVELSLTHKLGKIVYNRGAGGFRTEDFIANIHEMLLDLEPSKVFINIGTNDIRTFEDGTAWDDNLQKQYDFILGQCKEKLPEAKVYVMAYYPMNETDEEFMEMGKLFGSIRSNEKIRTASSIASALAEKHGFTYIDVNQGLTDETGNLKREFCKDGIHMYADAYDVVYRNLEKYL